MTDHKRLLGLVHYHRLDYKPYGLDDRDQGAAPAPDCSSGCRWARWLEGDLGMDWCVCTNPLSHRAGLLTFEHQGCRKAEADEQESA